MALVIWVVVYNILLKKVKQLQRVIREERTNLVKGLRLITSGVKELKLNVALRSSFLSQVLLKHSNVLKEKIISTSSLNIGIDAWSQSILYILVGGIIFLKGGEAPVTKVSFILTLLYISGPIVGIIGQFPMFSNLKVSLDKVSELGLVLKETTLEESNLLLLSDPNPHWKEIGFKGISYTYYCKDRERDFTIGPMDISIRKGELIFIIGGNGSGKTTFSKTLAGLYIPTAGEIYFDNAWISEEKREWYRQHFSAVFSDFQLFEQILDFIAPQSDAKAQAYLEELQLAHKVEFMDGKLSTTNLSQGQRKRLALFMAYMIKTPIYIFDEWAADQDPEFKEVFYKKLLFDLQKQGKTILAITHDDGYFSMANRIIKLDFGQVMYNGDYEGYLNHLTQRGEEKKYTFKSDPEKEELPEYTNYKFPFKFGHWIRGWGG